MSSCQALSPRYSLTGPTFERVVVAGGRVEFYPPTFLLTLILPSTTSNSFPIPTTTPRHSASASSTVAALVEHAKTAFSLPSSRNTRLWRLPDPCPPPVSDNPTTPEPAEGAFIFADALLQLEDVQLIEPDDSQATISEALLDEDLVRLGVEQADGLGNWLVERPATPPPSGAEDGLASSSTAAKKTSLFSGGGWISTFEKRNTVPNQLAPKYGNKNGKDKAPTLVTVPSNGGGGGQHSGLLNSLGGMLTRGKSGPKGGQRGLTGLGNLGK